MSRLSGFYIDSKPESSMTSFLQHMLAKCTTVERVKEPEICLQTELENRSPAWFREATMSRKVGRRLQNSFQS